MNDAYLIFDDNVAVTTSKISTNVVDLENISDVAKGQPVYINIEVSTAFTSAANTVDIVLISSDDATPNASDRFITLIAAKAASAMGSVGRIFKAALPEDIPYNTIGLSYVATTALAAGRFTSYLSIG